MTRIGMISASPAIGLMCVSSTRPTSDTSGLRKSCHRNRPVRLITRPRTALKTKVENPNGSRISPDDAGLAPSTPCANSGT